MLWKERLDKEASGEGCVWRVMALSECGVLRMRAVRMM